MISSSEAPQRPWKVTKYLNQYRYLAYQLYKEKGIPIALTFAVAGIETDWGNSTLAKESNNHFGIKTHEWEGPEFCTFTTEWQPEGGFLPVKDCFRKYPLIALSYQDFGEFLTSRPGYQQLFRYQRGDYGNWAGQLQESGYATDPFYAQKLLRVIDEYQLYIFDQE